MKENEIIDVMSRISLIKFMDGGPLRFAVKSRNHQRVIAGNSDNMPFVRNRFRVDVDS